MTMALTGKTAEEKIWNYLCAAGFNACGAAGLMGNLYAESGLSPTNLQNSYEKKLGYTDASYTAAVDSGAYANFVRDSAGYGLAQWTYWSRKQNLLDYARERGASIGDLEMQLGFLLKELGSYGLLAELKAAPSVRRASDTVLLKFEKPAGMNSEATQSKRAGFGQAYYDKYATKKEEGTVAKLTPNAVYTMNGVTINEKIIPDGTRWKDAAKAQKAGFAANALYKAQRKLSGGTGKVAFVTIHNTNDLANVHDDGEQYTRATWPNENMNSSRVHFYVDDTGAWQNLKAGTGLCSADPVGSAEVSWHSGDGSVANGGNMTSLSIEVIMNESADHDKVAKDNGARIAAWLLWKNGLGINALVTHTYWVNKSAGKTFSDVDEQCCNPISGRKWCPTYIFASSNKQTAMKNWKAFKALVKGYLDKLNGGGAAPAPAPSAPVSGVPYKVRVTASVLNIRKGPGTNYGTNGSIKDKGVYTIVSEAAGAGASKWGKLKSGAGWISLDYAKKV